MRQLDFETFLLVTNEILEQDTPELHLRAARWFDENLTAPDSVFQIFRGAGKSFLICVYAVWRLYHDPNLTIIILSGTPEVAADNAAFIRRLIEQNPFTEHLKGDGKWTDTKFFVKRERDTRNASVNCASLLGGNVGKRCDLMLVDDLETFDTVSEKHGPRRIRQMIDECQTIAQRQRIYIGTPWDTDSVYEELKKPDVPVFFQPWESGVWPDHPLGLFTDEWATKRKDELVENSREYYWNSQYLLIPDAPDYSGMSTDMIQKYHDELRTANVYLLNETTKDAYIGEDRIIGYSTYWDYGSSLSGRDTSVFAVVYKGASNNVYVHVAEGLPAKHPEKGYAPQCDRIVEICKQLGLPRVLVEGNVLTSYDQELREAAKRANVRLHVKTQARSKASAKKFDVPGLASVKDKIIFGALNPLLDTRRLYIHAKGVDPRFLAQLRQFPNGQHDDFIDAVAGAIANLRGDVFSFGNAEGIPSNVRGGQFDINGGNRLSRFGAVR